MLEATLEKWKVWYSEYRSEDHKVVDAIEGRLDDETELVRLWIAQDGKAPKGAVKYQSRVWKNKNSKGVKPAKGLVIITAVGQPPLILTNKNSSHLSDDTSTKKDKHKAKKADTSRPLSRPLQWRCKDCGERFESNTPDTHCSRRPRQLAEVSKETTKWFDKFLNYVQWEFVPHHSISEGQIGVIEDGSADKIAVEAGKELENILNTVEMAAPDVFELYNYKTRYLRVSDLKDFRKFKMVITKIAQWRKMKIRPNNSAPIGIIEIGHAFDEFLSSTFNNISSDNWDVGTRVWFNCKELGVTVSGTPDLSFRGVPVETKTVKLFPSEIDDPNQQSIFSYKWKTNYSKQAALYLQGCEDDWMLLLLISRETGKFTLVPVNDEAMTRMRNDWEKWAADELYSQKLAEYRAMISEEE
tara:strand:+ start:833 stop:2071 length:1239 start_codon:yes stop_codon:yes gene_type:complete